jgi:UDP-N-acetyl-D-glucosamine dehydrogenase
VGYDTNLGKINRIKNGKSPVEVVTSETIVQMNSSGNYSATANQEDISDSDIVVIAVPTPLDTNRHPDLSYIESACEILGTHLSKVTLIINESTSFPGTIRNVIKPKIESINKNLIHQYAISPERVDPGRSDWDQKNTPRIIAGLSPEATDATREFYSKFCENLIEVSSPEVAETAKLFENTFRQVNIALVNEFAIISNALEIPVKEVLEAAATKPYGFMKFLPSAGVGGHCIPVDPSYLSFAANSVGVKARFIELANEINLEMPNYIVSRVVADNGGKLAGKKILVIGIAYKADVSDVRESPAISIIKALKSEGAIVSWHDEIVNEWGKDTSCEAIGFDIAILATRHSYLADNQIMSAANYVFDCTGTCKGATQL